jgi:hypothetical protein
VEQDAGMTDDREQRNAADQLEQRYVAEHAETEQLLEGLDPDVADGGQSAEQVEGVAQGAGTADEVDEMTRKDR